MKSEREKVKRILQYRMRGYSLSSIGGIFHKSRERIRQLIKKYENEPMFKNLYKRIRKIEEILKEK